MNSTAVQQVHVGEAGETLGVTPRYLKLLEAAGVIPLRNAMRAALPAWIYRQEYECSFEETEDQVFGYDLVSAAITDEVTPLFPKEAS